MSFLAQNKFDVLQMRFWSGQAASGTHRQRSGLPISRTAHSTKRSKRPPLQWGRYQKALAGYDSSSTCVQSNSFMVTHHFTNFKVLVRPYEDARVNQSCALYD